MGRCTRKGCGKDYDPADIKDECIHHTGAPVSIVLTETPQLCADDTLDSTVSIDGMLRCSTKVCVRVLPARVHSVIFASRSQVMVLLFDREQTCVGF